MPQLSKLDKLQQRIDALRLLLNDAQQEYNRLRRNKHRRVGDATNTKQQAQEGRQ